VTTLQNQPAHPIPQSIRPATAEKQVPDRLNVPLPTVSVITLTRDRFDKLSLCLDRLLPQLRDGDEMLVIDTGSTDQTRSFYAQWFHPHVRFLTHDQEGSWAEARNFGVRAARGDLIAFLDDDCYADEDWVARGREALGEADAVGGLVRPHGIDHWPAWWHPEMGWIAGLSVPGHLGPDAGRVHYPFTANLWARAAVCRAIPFQEVGGRLGSHESEHYAAGREDAQWWRRLRVEGYRTRFDLDLGVEHAIDPARLDLAYLRRRAQLDGQSWARREGAEDDIGPLAYQWWRQIWLAEGAPFWAGRNWIADHHLHHLTRRRHGGALRFLTVKLRGDRLSAKFWLARRMLAGGVRLIADRAKNLGRVVLGPYWTSRPRGRGRREAERLAVVAFGFIGDLVILQSVLRGLIQAHPGAQIHVLVPESGKVLFGDLPGVNLTVLPSLKPASRQAIRWLRDWLEGVSPDVIAAPYLHEPWGPTLTAIRRPPCPIFGFDRDHGLPRMRQVQRLTVQVHKNLELHESENLCQLFAEVGLPCEAVPAQLAPDPRTQERIEADGWLAGGSPEKAGSLIMLNPDAGHPQKEWTDAAWTELIGTILDWTDARIVVNSFKPRPHLESNVTESGDRVHWLRAAPLEELAAWLSRCRLIVTVDAGPQHLAHALGVPSLTLYGPMDERRWTDRWQRPIHHAIRACAFDLTDEERRGLPPNSMVELIRVGDVFDRVKVLIEQTGGIEH